MGSNADLIPPSKLLILHGYEEEVDDALALLLSRGLEQMQMVKLQGIAFSDADDDTWRPAVEVSSVESKRATLDLLDMGQAAVVKLPRSKQPTAPVAAATSESDGSPGHAQQPALAGGRDPPDGLRTAAGGRDPPDGLRTAAGGRDPPDGLRTTAGEDAPSGGEAMRGETLRTVFEEAEDDTLRLVSLQSHTCHATYASWSICACYTIPV